MAKIIHQGIVYSDTDTYKQPYLINGVASNGVSNVLNYGDCSTAGETAAKVATCQNFSLIEGAFVNIRFVYTNSAAVAELTLNVNSTGAKSIRCQGSVLPSADTISSGCVYTFVYDGTYWELTGGTGISAGTQVVAITAEDYAALSDTQKNNGNLYIITNPSDTIGDLEYEIVSTF